jgi:hypothetical protein
MVPNYHTIRTPCTCKWRKIQFKNFSENKYHVHTELLYFWSSGATVHVIIHCPVTHFSGLLVPIIWDRLHFVLQQYPFVTVQYCQQHSFFSTKQNDVYLLNLISNTSTPYFIFSFIKPSSLLGIIYCFECHLCNTWLLHRYFTYYVKTCKFKFISLCWPRIICFRSANSSTAY